MIATYFLVGACVTSALGGLSLLFRVWQATEMDRGEPDSAEQSDRTSILFAYLINLFMVLGTKKRSVWMELVLLSIGTACGVAFLGLSSHA